MSADILASASVRPFPCDTESEREFGRHATTTGMPIRSRPVIFAILVMPIDAMCGRTLSKLASLDSMRVAGAPAHLGQGRSNRVDNTALGSISRHRVEYGNELE